MELREELGRFLEAQEELKGRSTSFSMSYGHKSSSASVSATNYWQPDDDLPSQISSDSDDERASLNARFKAYVNEGIPSHKAKI